MTEHMHVCPDCKQAYRCNEAYDPGYDTDYDCRWFDAVVCGPCMKLRASALTFDVPPNRG